MKSLILIISIMTTALSFTTQQDQFISLFDQPQLIEIDATIRINKCNNKAYIPIDLPLHTKGWIYSIVPIRKKEISSIKGTLLQEVQALAKNHASEKIPDFLTPAKNNHEFNFYIIKGKEHVESFYNCGYYEYIEKYINTKARKGYVKYGGNASFYIGFENAKDAKNLRLKIEAVAVL